ncbi:MAG: hypothetical protein AAGA64_02195 [Bacteroidota bacterium]
MKRIFSIFQDLLFRARVRNSHATNTRTDNGLKEVLSPLNIQKIEESIIKAAGENVAQSLIEQEIEIPIEQKKADIDAYHDGVHEPLKVKLSGDEAKYEDLSENFSLHLQERIDNPSVQERKARDAMVNRISQLKRQIAKSLTAKKILELKTNRL